jgi:hypothetical protein
MDSRTTLDKMNQFKLLSTMPGFVAVEPFDSKEITPLMHGGVFATTAQRDTLTARKVVFHYEGTEDTKLTIRAGDRVWLSSEDCKTSWASKVLEAEGQKFILVPIASVRLAERTYFFDDMARE